MTRAEQKLQTRQALMDAARLLMESGRGFGSLSLREVARHAGIVPTGFYRHFSDMDALGLALVAEVGETFRATLREVRQNEFEHQGLIEASTRIFLDAVSANRGQFLFLAREQYGGSQLVRQAIAALRQRITDDLAADLKLMNRMPHLDGDAIDVVADLVVKTVFATLPELIDPPADTLPPHLQPEAKITQQLRFIMIGDSPIDGSSSMSSFGRLIIARPIASICCSPPEKVPAGCWCRSPRIGKSSYAALRSLSISRSRRANAPRRRFCSTDSRGKIRRPSGEWAMPRLTMSCAAAFSMRLPWKRIEPALGRMSPEMVRRVVVFPAPFVPMRVTTSPSSTEKLIPLTALILPYETTRSLTSSMALTRPPLRRRRRRRCRPR